MTKQTVSRRNHDVADYLRHTTISNRQEATTNTQASPSGTKTPTDPAFLAQQSATETSWAERYVPSTPSETVMTPSASSVAGTESRSVAGQNNYMAPEGAPPTYELATSEASVRRPPAAPQAQADEIAPPQPSQLITHPSQEQPPTRRPFLPGRRYSRHETSNSIHGTFTLHDSLNLSTTSGSINISIDVKPGPDPAILQLKTKSGSIHIDDTQHSIAARRPFGRSDPRACPPGGGPLGFLFGWTSKSSQAEAPPMPATDDPCKQAGQIPRESPAATVEEATEPTFVARVIHTTIETSSGSVNGSLILTPNSDTRIITSSGSLNLRLVTTGSASRQLSKLEVEDFRNLQSARDLSSVFRTQTGSGSQNLHVTTGWSDYSDGGIISACRALHRGTGSGSMNVHYPPEWTGLIHASVGGSGSTNVRGSGLEYDKRGNGEVYAWRGVDEPDLERAVEVRIDGSGSIGFFC